MFVYVQTRLQLRRPKARPPSLQCCHRPHSNFEGGGRLEESYFRFSKLNVSLFAQQQHGQAYLLGRHCFY